MCRSNRERPMALTETGRERLAERLLRSSAAHNYDPDVDIDWSAPFVPGTFYILEHRCSLYGTALWDQLGPDQRIELSKHELASIFSTGIWLELLLMRLLIRMAYRTDPVSRLAQY